MADSRVIPYDRQSRVLQRYKFLGDIPWAMPGKPAWQEFIHNNTYIEVNFCLSLNILSITYSSEKEPLDLDHNSRE